MRKVLSEIEYLGKIYGQLTILSFNLPKKKYRKDGHIENMKIVNCQCSCGNLWTGYLQSIRNGDTISCGCYAKTRYITHGFSKRSGITVEYTAWAAMKDRCYNRNNVKNYKDYGGRGIIVCDEWLHDFSKFLKDMGLKPTSKHSLDRKNVNGNYCKENCRWATQEEQANNTRTNKYITYKNKTQTLSQWCRELNLKYRTISRRLTDRWTVERAFETTVRQQKNN